MRCPWCGNKNDLDARECAFCGKDLLEAQTTEGAVRRLVALDLPIAETICPACGAHHTALAEYCTLCGSSFVIEESVPAPLASRDTAAEEQMAHAESAEEMTVDQAQAELDSWLLAERERQSTSRTKLRTVVLSVLLALTLLTVFWGHEMLVRDTYDSMLAEAAVTDIVLPVPPASRLRFVAGDIAYYISGTPLEELDEHYADCPEIRRLESQGFRVLASGFVKDGYRINLGRGEEPSRDLIRVFAYAKGGTTMVEIDGLGPNTVAPPERP